MSTDSIQLASLIASRLCHDLLSPVGGMANGIELLVDETDPKMREQCIDLLAQGARRTATRLRFFRLAFGAAGGFDAQLPAAEIEELVRAQAAEGRDIDVQWAVSVAELSKSAAKVLLNYALIGIDALPRGGTLAIAAEEREGSYEIAVRAEGMRIAFDKDIGRALEGGIAMDDLSAHTAPAMLVRLLAQECGGGVQHALTPGEGAGGALVLGAILPRG
jgi:histidine phosphotransferase ChpT